MKKKLNSNYNNDSFYQSPSSKSKSVSPPVKEKTSPQNSTSPTSTAKSQSTFDKLQSLLVSSNTNLRGSFSEKVPRINSEEDVKLDLVEDYDDSGDEKSSPRNGTSYDEYDDAKMERKGSKVHILNRSFSGPRTMTDDANAAAAQVAAPAPLDKKTSRLARLDSFNMELREQQLLQKRLDERNQRRESENSPNASANTLVRKKSVTLMAADDHITSNAYVNKGRKLSRMLSEVSMSSLLNDDEDSDEAKPVRVIVKPRMSFVGSVSDGTPSPPVNKASADYTQEDDDDDDEDFKIEVQGLTALGSMLPPQQQQQQQPHHHHPNHQADVSSHTVTGSATASAGSVQNGHHRQHQQAQYSAAPAPAAAPSSLSNRPLPEVPSYLASRPLPSVPQTTASVSAAAEAAAPAPSPPVLPSAAPAQSASNVPSIIANLRANALAKQQSARDLLNSTSASAAANKSANGPSLLSSASSSVTSDGLSPSGPASLVLTPTKSSEMLRKISSGSTDVSTNGSSQPSPLLSPRSDAKSLAFIDHSYSLPHAGNGVHHHQPQQAGSSGFQLQEQHVQQIQLQFSQLQLNQQQQLLQQQQQPPISRIRSESYEAQKRFEPQSGYQHQQQMLSPQQMQPAQQQSVYQQQPTVQVPPPAQQVSTPSKMMSPTHATSGYGTPQRRPSDSYVEMSSGGAASTSSLASPMGSVSSYRQVDSHYQSQGEQAPAQQHLHHHQQQQQSSYAQSSVPYGSPAVAAGASAAPNGSYSSPYLARQKSQQLQQAGVMIGDPSSLPSPRQHTFSMDSTNSASNASSVSERVVGGSGNGTYLTSDGQVKSRPMYHHAASFNDLPPKGTSSSSSGVQQHTAPLQMRGSGSTDSHTMSTNSMLSHKSASAGNLTAGIKPLYATGTPPLPENRKKTSVRKYLDMGYSDEEAIRLYQKDLQEAKNPPLTGILKRASEDDSIGSNSVKGPPQAPKSVKMQIAPVVQDDDDDEDDTLPAITAVSTETPEFAAGVKLFLDMGLSRAEAVSMYQEHLRAEAAQNAARPTARPVRVEDTSVYAQQPVMAQQQQQMPYTSAPFNAGQNSSYVTGPYASQQRVATAAPPQVSPTRYDSYGAPPNIGAYGQPVMQQQQQQQQRSTTPTPQRPAYEPTPAPLQRSTTPSRLATYDQQVQQQPGMVNASVMGAAPMRAATVYEQMGQPPMQQRSTTPSRLGTAYDQYSPLQQQQMQQQQRVVPQRPGVVYDPVIQQRSTTPQRVVSVYDQQAPPPMMQQQQQLRSTTPQRSVSVYDQQAPPPGAMMPQQQPLPLRSTTPQRSVSVYEQQAPPPGVLLRQGSLAQQQLQQQQYVPAGNNLSPYGGSVGAAAQGQYYSPPPPGASMGGPYSNGVAPVRYGGGAGRAHLDYEIEDDLAGGVPPSPQQQQQQYGGRYVTPTVPVRVGMQAPMMQPSPYQQQSMPAPMMRSMSEPMRGRSDDDYALHIGILVSQQESKYGCNMFDTVKPEDEREIARLMAEGKEKELALQIIFERKFGGMNSMPRRY